jgi:psp operon transcriptional activator
VLVLADHFGRRMAAEMGRDDWEGFSRAASEALVAYDWPGNVRELRNVVERAVYRWETGGAIDTIEFDPFQSPHRPASATAPAPLPVAPADVVEEANTVEPPEPEAPSDFKTAIARFECELLEKALADARFNQRAAAKALGLSYDQFRHSLRKHGLMPG